MPVTGLGNRHNFQVKQPGGGKQPPRSRPVAGAMRFCKAFLLRVLIRNSMNNFVITATLDLLEKSFNSRARALGGDLRRCALFLHGTSLILCF